jgi:rhodanese-related sulfurtransferase
MSSTDRASGIELTPDQVATWMAEPAPPQLIDVREPYEREAGRLEDTDHIPLGELTARADSVERGRPVIFYCRSGARSQMAAQAFRAGGFEAYTMVGGLLQWAGEGRPLVPEGGRVADH